MDKKFSKFQCYKLDRIADCEILKDDYFDKTHLDYMKVKCECGEEHYFVKIRGEDHGQSKPKGSDVDNKSWLHKTQ